jgi:hypothetical protein
MVDQFIKLKRNTTLFKDRETAVAGLKAQLESLGDGEICVASYGADFANAKTIFGIARVDGETKSSTIYDIDGTIGDLNFTDKKEDGKFVTCVNENGGIISVGREKPQASQVDYTTSMTVQAAIKKLMDKNYPLTASCTINPTALQEVGNTASVTIQNFKVTTDGQNVNITKKTINNAEVTGESFTDSITASKTYSIVLTTADGDAKISKTVTFVGPIYVGYSSETTASETDMKNLTDKQSLRTSIGTITFNKSTAVSDGEYVTIYAPSTIKVNKIISAGLDIISEFATSTMTYQKLSYTCYRHNAKTTSAELTIQ